MRDLALKRKGVRESDVFRQCVTTSSTIVTGASSAYLSDYFGARQREILSEITRHRIEIYPQNGARVRRPNIFYGLAKNTRIRENSDDTVDLKFIS